MMLRSAKKHVFKDLCCCHTKSYWPGPANPPFDMTLTTDL